VVFSADYPTVHAASTDNYQSLKFDQRRRSIVIPFEYINGFLVVSLRLDDKVPVKFLFDTGSKLTILTEESILPLLGRKPQEEIRIIGSDMSVELRGRILRRVDLQIEEHEIRSQPLIILDSGVLDLQKLTGESISGILGVGAFGAYAIRVDYSAGEIRLERSPSARRLRRYASLPVIVESDRFYLSARVSVHPGYTDSLKLLLDTGASLSLLINTKPGDTLVYPPRLVIGDIGTGLGGALYGYVGRSDSVSFGPYSIPQVITHFQTASDSLSTGPLQARGGIIGNELLERFDVIFDYPESKLHLRPVRKLSKSKAYDRSGMRVVKDGVNLNGVRVQYVNRDTPAWKAGIRPGDRVLKVGRVPVNLLGINGVRRRLRARPGRRVSLLIVRQIGRGDVEVTVEFRLAELI